MKRKARVLFVCLGNICRSPTAEAVFRSLVKAQGLADAVEIESCGMGTWNLGKPPHPDTQAVLKARGIPFDGMRAKNLSTDDINSYDYVIAMDRSNVEDLFKQGADPNKVQLLTAYVPGKEGQDVPDPYYYGDFDGVFDLIQEGVGRLLERIQTDVANG